MEQLRLTKRQIVVLFVVAMVCVSAFILLQERREAAELAASPAGQAFGEASGVVLLNEAGEEVVLNVNERRITVVHFWASWVPTAASSLQALDTVAAQTASEAKTRFLAINRSEPASRVEAFFNKYDRPRHLEIMTDSTDALFSELESYAMPETVIFDTNGEVYWRKRGDIQTEEVAAVLAELE